MSGELEQQPVVVVVQHARSRSDSGTKKAERSFLEDHPGITIVKCPLQESPGQSDFSYVETLKNTITSALNEYGNRMILVVPENDRHSSRVVDEFAAAAKLDEEYPGITNVTTAFLKLNQALSSDELSNFWTAYGVSWLHRARAALAALQNSGPQEILAAAGIGGSRARGEQQLPSTTGNHPPGPSTDPARRSTGNSTVFHSLGR